MKTLPRYFVVVFLGILLFTPQRAFASGDEYDDSQSHPLRVVAYVVHPVGVLLEWIAARPFHALVSATPTLEYIFGHNPHPPLFAEPQPRHDFGVPKKVPMRDSVPPRRVEPHQPVAERVVVKEVPVEKTVIREVPKVVEIEKVVFPDIAFQFDSAELTDLGKGKAYLVAERLKEKSEIVVSIEGHADYIGTDEYNIKLGLRRAERVKKELMDLGIDATRMSTTSLGESKPLIDQKTDWARAVNRRVEFSVKAP